MARRDGDWDPPTSHREKDDDTGDFNSPQHYNGHIPTLKHPDVYLTLEFERQL